MAENNINAAPDAAAAAVDTSGTAQQFLSGSAVNKVLSTLAALEFARPAGRFQRGAGFLEFLDAISELEAEIRRLMGTDFAAHGGADSRDAVRYRWLRNTQNTEARDPGEGLTRQGTIESIMVCEGDGCSSAPHADELDTAIDAAIARQRGGK